MIPSSPPLPLIHTRILSAPFVPGLLVFGARVLELRHDSKDGVVATDARPDLLVVLLGVADLVELRLCQQADPD